MASSSAGGGLERARAWSADHWAGWHLRSFSRIFFCLDASASAARASFTLCCCAFAFSTRSIPLLHPEHVPAVGSKIGSVESAHEVMVANVGVCCICSSIPRTAACKLVSSA